MKPVNAMVARAGVEAAIARHEQQVAQWAGMADYERAAQYKAKAEVLQDLLAKCRGDVSRDFVLKRIEQNLTMLIGIADTGDYALGAQYQSRATGLVELLEFDDAGTCGGYDTSRDQPSPMTVPGRKRLRMRADWLKRLPVAA